MKSLQIYRPIISQQIFPVDSRSIQYVLTQIYHEMRHMTESFSIRNGEVYTPQKTIHPNPLNVENPFEYVVDEIDDPYLFSNEPSWLSPAWDSSPLSLPPIPSSFERENVFSGVQLLCDEAYIPSLFDRLLDNYGMTNMYDPYNSIQRKLCMEWTHRHEVGLRNIYFPNMESARVITLEDVCGLYVRYRGRDSPLLRMSFADWPLMNEDPTGINTLKDTDRPKWLLNYIYTLLLAEGHGFDILRRPQLWSLKVKNIVIATNLPLPLLHPVELETEEGNPYFPVTGPEFDNWIKTNKF